MNISHRGRVARLMLCAFLLHACGCASVNPEEDYEKAASSAAGAIGDHALFDPNDDQAAAQKSEELLRDGISVTEAVQIALLNNAAFQAKFYRVGMSRADLVQSGLFSNPSLALSVAFPEGGGRSNIQATLAQNIVDIWQIPIRKRIAQARLEQEILSLSASAAILFVETKVAYFSAVGVAGVLEIAHANLNVANGLLDTTMARQKAGTVGELDVNLARGTVLAGELEVQTARLDAANARRRLATLLGLTLDADELLLTDPLPSEQTPELGEDQIVMLAGASRLDLQAARQAAEAGRQRVSEEYAKIFPDISVGTYLERTERRALPGRDIAADTARASVAAGGLAAPDIQSKGQRDQERRQEIDTIFGPAFTMTLPIFDQNQAQIAKAEYAYQAALKELEALERSIVQQARQALDQAATASNVSRSYAEKVLPQAQKSLDLADAAYRAGKTSIVTVLDAQRYLLTARRLATSAQQAAAAAQAELERVVGRPLAALTDVNQQPAHAAGESEAMTAANGEK